MPSHVNVMCTCFQEGSTLPGQLLRPHPALSPPDMAPFFLRQYVKGHANDVFEDYPQLLTEMMLRLPYQARTLIRTLYLSFQNGNVDMYFYVCWHSFTQGGFPPRYLVRYHTCPTGALLFICLIDTRAVPRPIAWEWFPDGKPLTRSDFVLIANNPLTTDFVGLLKQIEET